MPRPCSRKFHPYLKVLRGIALDENQPTPLRLRAAELCVAIRSGEWAILSNRAAQRAIREIAAVDSIDQQLLGLNETAAVSEREKSTDLKTSTDETPDAAIDDLIAHAEVERKKNRKLEQLRGIVADESLTPGLRESAREQLRLLEALMPPRQPTEEEKGRDEIKAILDDILGRGKTKPLEQVEGSAGFWNSLKPAQDKEEK